MVKLALTLQLHVDIFFNKTNMYGKVGVYLECIISGTPAKKLYILDGIIQDVAH